MLSNFFKHFFKIRDFWGRTSPFTAKLRGGYVNFLHTPPAPKHALKKKKKKKFKTGHAQVNRPIVAGGTVTTGDSGTLTPHGKGHSHGKFFTPSLSRATDVPEVAQHRPVK